MAGYNMYIELKKLRKSYQKTVFGWKTDHLLGHKIYCDIKLNKLYFSLGSIIGLTSNKVR